MSWLLGAVGKGAMPTQEEALPGREERTPVPGAHAVLGHPMTEPYPEGLEVAEFALGCFWGVEQMFWQLDGVWTTAAGYAGGFTPNPTYEEVCTGRTGHAETVRVVYDPVAVSYDELLRIFWENHDPTQGMRQGNDRGTQYRSAIFVHGDEQREAAERSRDAYAKALGHVGYGQVTTQIVDTGSFYYAEDYHQQYLHKNPAGYCPIHATGVTMPATG